MIANRFDVPLYETEDGRGYCLFSDIDERVRQAIYDFAHARGETFLVDNEEACPPYTIITFQVATVGPGIMA